MRCADFELVRPISESHLFLHLFLSWDCCVEIGDLDWLIKLIGSITNLSRDFFVRQN